MLTVEQLMQPRWKVINTWPYSPFAINEIVLENDERTEYGEGIFWGDEEGFRIYPHLFKRLEWWEHRDEKDMPEYVKFQENVYKVIKYKKPNIVRIIDDFWKVEVWQKIGEPYWLPATLSIQQEARALVEKYKAMICMCTNHCTSGSLKEDYEYDMNLAANQCALICVDEILNEFPQGFKGNFEEVRKKHWQDVRKYITQL